MHSNLSYIDIKSEFSSHYSQQLLLATGALIDTHKKSVELENEIAFHAKDQEENNLQWGITEWFKRVHLPDELPK